MRKARRGEGVPASTGGDRWQTARAHLASVRDAAATVAGWVADRLLLSAPVAAVLTLVLCPCFAMASRDAPTAANTQELETEGAADEEGGPAPPRTKKSSSIKGRVRRWRRKHAPVDAADRTRLVNDQGEDSTLHDKWADDLDGAAAPQRDDDDDDDDDDNDNDDNDLSGDAAKATKRAEVHVYEL